METIYYIGTKLFSCKKKKDIGTRFMPTCISLCVCKVIFSNIINVHINM